MDGNRAAASALPKQRHRGGVASKVANVALDPDEGCSLVLNAKVGDLSVAVEAVREMFDISFFKNTAKETDVRPGATKKPRAPTL